MTFYAEKISMTSTSTANYSYSYYANYEPVVTEKEFNRDVLLKNLKKKHKSREPKKEESLLFNPEDLVL